MTKEEYLKDNNLNIDDCAAIKFLKTHPDAVLPERKHDDLTTGDSGYDMTAVEDVLIPARSSRQVATGVTLADMPPGIWFRIEHLRYGVLYATLHTNRCSVKHPKTYIR